MRTLPERWICPLCGAVNERDAAPPSNFDGYCTSVCCVHNRMQQCDPLPEILYALESREPWAEA
jgi:hypothetical protein